MRGGVQQGHRSGVSPDELKKARQGTRAAHGRRGSIGVVTCGESHSD